MKYAVRFYSKTGNTKLLADAVAQVLGCDALPVSESLNENTELLFLGSSVYAGQYDKAVGAFLEENKSKIGTIVCFGSSASGKTTAGKISAWAEKNGVKVCDKVFTCPGHFLFMHKERPDSRDLEAVAAFVKDIAAGV
ncbi:MAG: flavodoxin [Clostridia bacterium]|nr:flavodoxin [Clostridia bacterium]